MNPRKRKLSVLGIILLGIGLTLVILQDHGQWLEVDGQRFWVRLTEYDPPVQIGMQAPPLPWRHRRLLASVDKALDWTELSLEEARALASVDDIDNLAQELIKWKAKLAANPELITYNQKTIEYALEVRQKSNPRTYLLVCGAYGLNSGRSTWPHGVPCSVYVRDGKHWRACGRDPVKDVILRSIPHAKIGELRSFLSRT